MRSSPALLVRKLTRLFAALRFYHFFMGPLLWRRQAPADAGTIGVKSNVPDYRIVRDAEGIETRGELAFPQTSEAGLTPSFPSSRRCS